MLKKIMLKFSHIGNLVVSWFNFMMFFAMRPCWSGISKTLKYEEMCEKFGVDHFISNLILNLPAEFAFFKSPSKEISINP